MTTLCFDFCSVTSNAHNHVHEHAHPHADSESDSERVDRLVIFLETHFGEVHIGVPEPEKGHEDGQDEGPEQALLIRLDEADAIVHLKSMVSYPFIGSLHFSFFPPLSFTFLPRQWGRGEAEVSSKRHLHRVARINGRHFAYRRNFFPPRP